MGAIFDSLAKADPDAVHDCTAQTLNPTEALQHMRKATPKPGVGQIDREVGNHPTEEVVIEEPFDAAVRRQVTAAGGDYVSPVKPKPVDPELARAVQRLADNSALLNKAVALTRKRKAGSASGSVSGNTISAGGSTSGARSAEDGTCRQ